MLSVPPVQVPLALANAPLSNSRGAGVCQASRHRWGSLRGMLHGWQSAFLPQRAACVLSTQSHATARRSDAVKNASRCDCQRMPLQSPTHAAAVDIQTRQTGGQTPGAFIPIPHWGGGQAGLPRFRWKPAPPHSTRMPKANSHAATEHTPLPAGGRGGFHKPKTVRRPTWGNAPFLTQISRLRVRKEKRSDSHGQLLLTNNLY